MVFPSGAGQITWLRWILMGFSKSRDYLDAEEVDPPGPIEFFGPQWG